MQSQECPVMYCMNVLSYHKQVHAPSIYQANGANKQAMCVPVVVSHYLITVHAYVHDHDMLVDGIAAAVASLA